MKKLLAGCALCINFVTQAEPVNCLTSPSRIEPCTNLVYRSVEDPKNQTTRVFCFCKQDFQRLLNNDVTDKEYMLNKMEWRQILADTGYTDAQLKALIRP